MNCRIDDGFKHESKILEKKLSCPPLSGFNHIAVYLRWAYNKGLLLDSVLESEPRLKAALDGEGDLREVIANSELLKGKIKTDIFTEEGALFTRCFYQFNDCKFVYPLCVDRNAKAYFGEGYKNKEFKHEAYLFVPYDEEYYVNLSKYIDDAWNNRSGIIVEHKPVLLAVRLTPGVISRIFNNKPGHFPDKKRYRLKLVDLANDPSKHLGRDKNGNEWNAQIEPDGTQTWVCYRDGIISDGGFFDPPRTWNEESGFIIV